MRKSRQKKQTFSQRRQGKTRDWIVKPLSEHHKDKIACVDDVEQPQTSLSSNTEPSHGIKFKWVSSKSGAHVEKPGFRPKPELGESSSGIGPKPELGESSSGVGPKLELGESSSGIGRKTEVGESSFDERESEFRERKCGVQEEKVVGSQVGGEKIEGFDLSKEVGGSVDDVVGRLVEIQFGVEEVELSEEQIRINDQAQEDELLAMESIYGDNVYVLEKQSGLRSFQIHIHIELPSTYTVSAKLNADINANSNSKLGASDEFLYSFRIQSYPSHSPPAFTVSVQWLHESKISKLCSMLDFLWNEQPGLEILYQWVDWLHSSSLPYLGFMKSLCLDPTIREVLQIGVLSPEVFLLTLIYRQ
ncbi:E3 ubiquitin-protein ligase RNF14 [Bienertia sinuspersici]